MDVNSKSSAKRYTAIWENDGKEYTLTLAEWADLTGIPKKTLQTRLLSLGWSPQRAMNEVYQKRPVYFYEGEYRSLAEISQMTGVNQKTLSKRIHNGYTLEKAISPVQNAKKYTAVWQGDNKKHTLTLLEWAELTGIAAKTLYQRIHVFDWDPQRAFNSKKHSPITYLFEGEWRSIPEISKMTGVVDETIKYRLRKGMTIEEAVSKERWISSSGNVSSSEKNPKKKEKRTVKRYLYNGQMLTPLEISELTGLSENLVRSRLFHGRPLDETYLPAKSSNAKYVYTYCGKKRSLYEIAGITGAPYPRLLYYIKKGDSLDEALQRVVDKEKLSELQSGPDASPAPPSKKGRKPVTYLVNGESLTVYELSQRYGVREATLYDRLKSGLSPEEAILQPDKLSPRKAAPKYLYEGQYYSIREISEMTGIPTYTVKDVLKKDGNLDNLKAHRKTLYVYKGEKRSLSEISRLCGVKRDTLSYRLAKGLSIEEAAEKTGLKKYVYKNKPRSVSEISEMTGISVSTLRTRLRKGCPLEQAISAKPVINGDIKPVKKSKKCPDEFFFLGEMRSLQKIAELSGLKVATLRTRIYQGMSIEEATKRGEGPKKYLYNGKEYSLSELSKEYGISDTALRRRLNKGMSVAEAIETPRRAPQRYHFRGQDRTIVEISKLTGINTGTLRGRLLRGETINQATKHTQDGPVKILFEGKYRSLRDIALSIGISPKVLAERQAQGLPLDEESILGLKSKDRN